MKKFKKISLYLLLLVLALSLVACETKKEDTGEEDVNLVENVDENGEEVDKDISKFPVEVEDIFGNKVTIEKEPEKIISLAPSNTEILFALGLGEKVVGVTINDDYPQEATTKEVVGDYNGNNLERIVELEPDLVLVYGPGNEDDNKVLREAGIIVLGFEAESIEAVMEDIKTIGRATGQEDKALEVVTSMEDKKNEVIEKVKDVEEVKVFYEIWHDPLMAAGKGSFMDELITLAGGRNIAEDAEGKYPQYDLEQLIERDPEVYLTAKDMEDKTVESMKARPGFEGITAMKNDGVYILDPNITSRPGPRIVEALELVAKSIHPELFK